MPLSRLKPNIRSHQDARRIGIVLALGFFLLVALAAWISLTAIRARMLTDTASQLRALNNATALMLSRAGERMRENAGILVRDEEHQALIRAVLSHAADRDARFALRRHLAEDVFPQGFRDVLLLDRDGRIALSMRKSEQGKPAPEGVRPFVRAALAGEAVLSHPFLRHGAVRMWQLEPLSDAAGRVIGLLALELGEREHFGGIAGMGRFGISAETYLVDAEGRFLSASRFEAQLRRAGLLKAGQSSVLNLRLRDPGRNLLEKTPAGGVQPSAWPPTYAMAHLLPVAGAPAVHANMRGYRDYRGVPVFGVWQWDAARRLGIVTEIDVAEALAAWRHIRNLVIFLLVGVLLTGMMVALAYARFRRRAEAESNRLRNLLMESTAEAIYGVDADGCCTFMNRAGAAMLGYDSADELIGRNLHDVIHHSRADGSPYPVEECRIFRCFREKTRVHVRDEVFWRKDGASFPVEYRAHPLSDDAGKAIGGVVTFLDISKEIRAEEERTKMEKQVQHTQRLESLGVLAGGIAHDFNNILAAIMGNAELARMQMVEEPLAAKEKLECIEQSSARAANLCRQMLAYSGKGKFVVKPVNLSAMVEEITHLLEVSLDKSVVVKFQLAEGLPTIEADEAQMQQVLMNLVTNANDAIGGKSGVISISTGLMRADAEYLRDCYGDKPAPGRYVWVEVSDTGCGMDKETRQRIFDPFFTTKFTGRGLGMSAVLGIVRGHHGALKVYSEVGRGTTFKFLLPVLEQAGSEHAGDAVAEDGWRGHGCVLVVDDEESVRETAAMVVENLGFETLTAADGLEALEIYRRGHDGIDAVLMDLTMPRMSGEECFREMRRINPDVRVVLTSGYNEQDAIQHFTGKQLAGFVQKPATMAKLARALRAALEGEDEG